MVGGHPISHYRSAIPTVYTIHTVHIRMLFYIYFSLFWLLWESVSILVMNDALYIISWAPDNM